MKEIVCKLETEDIFSIQNAAFVVDLSTKDQYHYNFWDKEKRKLYQNNPFSNSALDLFNISLMVYYADRRIIRQVEDDAWTRKIKLYIPVIELEKWNENKSLLKKMLSFLSGDVWEFEFRKRELNTKEQRANKGMQRQKKKHHFDLGK